MFVIGIDTGNAQTKSPNFTISSGIKIAQKKPSVGDYLGEGGLFYIPTNERIRYQEDKTVSREFWALTNILIIKELNRAHAYVPNMEIALSIGLPPEHMFDKEKQQAWAAFFKKNGKNCSFEYNGKTYEYTIKTVKVNPQGYAVVFLNYADFAALTTSYIVDIGGYTLDIIRLHHAKIDNSLLISKEMGVITFFNAAINQVKIDTGIRIDEDNIRDFLAKGSTSRKDVTESLKIAFSEYSRKVVSLLSEYGIDLRINHVTFMGGGSILLKESLMEAADGNKDITFNSNVNANALGFQKILEATLRKG